MGIICFLKDTLGEKLLFFKIIWTVQKRAIYLHMCWESDYHCDFMLLDSVCSNRSDATFCVKLIYRQYQAQSWSVDKFGVMGCSFEWVMDINRDIGFFCNQSWTRGHNKFRKMWEIYPKMKKRSKKVESVIQNWLQKSRCHGLCPWGLSVNDLRSMFTRMCMLARMCTFTSPLGICHFVFIVLFLLRIYSVTWFLKTFFMYSNRTQLWDRR